MYKITLQLTDASITQAITKLEQLKIEVQNSVHKLLKYMADQGVEIAKANVRNIDSGATLSSIKAFMYLNEDKAVIIAGENAVWLEFGTGVAKNKSSYPLPLPNRIVPIGTFGKGHGSNPNGWLYETDDPRYIVATLQDGTTLGFTRGIKANKFMYQALCRIRDSAPKWAKSIFEGIK